MKWTALTKSVCFLLTAFVLISKTSGGNNPTRTSDGASIIQWAQSHNAKVGRIERCDGMRGPFWFKKDRRIYEFEIRLIVGGNTEIWWMRTNESGNEFKRGGWVAMQQ